MPQTEKSEALENAQKRLTQALPDDTESLAIWQNKLVITSWEEFDRNITKGFSHAIDHAFIYPYLVNLPPTISKSLEGQSVRFSIQACRSLDRAEQNVPENICLISLEQLPKDFLKLLRDTSESTQMHRDKPVFAFNSIYGDKEILYVILLDKDTLVISNEQKLALAVIDGYENPNPESSMAKCFQRRKPSLSYWAVRSFDPRSSDFASKLIIGEPGPTSMAKSFLCVEIRLPYDSVNMTFSSKRDFNKLLPLLSDLEYSSIFAIKEKHGKQIEVKATAKNPAAYYPLLNFISLCLGFSNR